MLSASRLWIPLELLISGVKGSYDRDIHRPPHYNTSHTSAVFSSVPTIINPSTSPIIYHNTSSSKDVTSVVTSYSSSVTTVTYCNTSAISSATTSTKTSYLNTSVASIPHYTTKWSASTTKSTVPSLITSSASYITTSYAFSTSFQSCPSTCSISAGTVELFYWPTNNDYTYPSTYVDTALDYTFTSPSVYMVINTIYGYNSLGLIGPSATSEIFALDLYEVSTIIPGGSATRQLSLSDLGTNCPQTVDPSVLATMTPDGRCNPSLVAPSAVKSWALPCNACGKFGLFDPPYAIPSIDGGLIGTTSVLETTTEITTSASPVASATGVMTTATTASLVATTATTTAVGLKTTTSKDIATSPESPSFKSSLIVTTESSAATFTTESSIIVSDPGSTTTSVVIALAPKIAKGTRCLIVALFISACILS